MPQSSRRCLYDAVERPKRYRRISRDPTDAEAIFADGQYLISDGIGDIGPSKRFTIRLCSRQPGLDLFLDHGPLELSEHA